VAISFQRSGLPRYFSASCSIVNPYGNGTANFERGTRKAMPEAWDSPATNSTVDNFSESIVDEAAKLFMDIPTALSANSTSRSSWVGFRRVAGGGGSP